MQVEYSHAIELLTEKSKFSTCASHVCFDKLY